MGVFFFILIMYFCKKRKIYVRKEDKEYNDQLENVIL